MRYVTQTRVPVEGQLPGVVYPRVPGHEAIGFIRGGWPACYDLEGPGQRVGVGFFLEVKKARHCETFAVVATRHIARTPLSLA